METTHLAQGHLGRHSQASLFAAGGLRGCDELMSLRWHGRAAYWPECPLPPRGTPLFPGGLVMLTEVSLKVSCTSSHLNIFL